MLATGGGFMVPSIGASIFFLLMPGMLPLLPAARLQLLGNRVLPGFPFLSCSVKCEGLVRLQASD